MHRSWNILCWNIRGINSDNKWDALRNKIDESACSIFFLQETKRDIIDSQYLKKFAPKRYDKFDYIPSVGASGGILIAWISSIFHGITIEKQPFAITVSFTAKHNGDNYQLFMARVLNRLGLFF